MSFTLHQVTQRAGGGDIIRTKNIEAAEPVIGRGTDCDIQIADLAVSLRHAVMRQLGRGRVEVKSLGQLSFEANGAFTKNVQLALADRPKLVFGSHELRLAPGPGADEIVVTLSRTESVAGEPDVQDEKTVFRLAASMFSRRSAAWTLGAALLALCLVLPAVVFALYRDTPVAASAPQIPRADVQWEGGALSPGHRFLEGNCQACHQKPFVSVRDDACVACHKAGLTKQVTLSLAAQLRNAGSAVAPEPARDHAAADRLARAQPSRDDLGHDIHAALARTFNHPDGRCASCHTEHVGPAAAPNVKMVTTDQVVGTDCAGCHAGLKHRLPDTALLDVADWERHPDFRPMVTVSPKEPRVERIALTDRPLENNGLIFPHDLHLSKTGGVARMAQELGRARGYGSALDCANCHRADADGRGYRPVEMVRDCSACHSLAFAHAGGRTMMLPHGHPDRVVAALTAFYESGEAASSDMSDLFRRRPGFDRMPPPPPSSDAVARSVRAVFSRGGACYGCHTIVAPPYSGSLAFDIAPVRLANRYLPRGGFDHSVPAHRVDANGQPICSSCHKAESSKRSADLLLPPIARCAACHGQSRHVTATAASDTCSECHGYHQPGAPAVSVAETWAPVKAASK